ncbi:hypothetical protein L596_006854 [Steinernema carpocapsae]|nr:hypothetical protein L596_006854 [Steinernema carpocapsae]
MKSLGTKTLVGNRLYQDGAAMRSRDRWLLTEYGTGYSLFEYRTNGSDTISSTDPYSIYSLDDPFQGTDHTLINNGRTFAYNMATSNSIDFVNLDTKRKIRRSLNISKEPLYKHSTSRVDIEFDEVALWVIYRKPGEKHITVSRFDPVSLSEKARWSLTYLPIEKNMTNSFVACGVLHMVTTATSGGRSTNRITPVFDFDSGSYTEHNGELNLEWKGYSMPSNVQYDQFSQSLNVFDRGTIYSININTD